MALPERCYPGLVLGSTSRFVPGPGTHVHDGAICASLIGRPAVDNDLAPPMLSVARPSTSTVPSSRSIAGISVLPVVGSIVLARVTRIQARQVNVAIQVVDDQVCADAFQGIVRKEDVRGWEVDKVVLGESFRVGDVVRGVVISLGDQASYYLSTARNELGVLLATSEVGNQMYPISWKAFRDPETGQTEERKVAKPL